MYRSHKVTNKQSSLFLFKNHYNLPSFDQYTVNFFVSIHKANIDSSPIQLLSYTFHTHTKKAGGKRKSCCCYNKYKLISLLLSFCLPFHFLHVNTPLVLKVHFHFAIFTLPITFLRYFSYIFLQKAQTLPSLLMKGCPKPAANHSHFSLRNHTSECLRKLDKNLLIYQVD